MTKCFGLLLLGSVTAGCVSNHVGTKIGSYEFKSKESRIEIDHQFRFAILNGKRKTLENCSDEFVLCVAGPISFVIPRQGCSKQIGNINKLDEMEIAARDHHSGFVWMYHRNVDNIVYQYDSSNSIVAIYYDFSGDGKAVSNFIDLENGRIDDISSLRLEASQAIAAKPCKN